LNSDKENLTLKEKPLRGEKHKIKLIAKEPAKYAAVAVVIIAISLFYVNDQKKSLTSVMNKISVQRAFLLMKKFRINTF